MSLFSNPGVGKGGARSANRRAKRLASRAKHRFGVEQLEARRMLAITITNNGPLYLFKGDGDSNNITLQFHQGTHVVNWIDDDTGPTNPGRTTGTVTADSITFIGGMNMGMPTVNSLECEDLSGGLYLPGEDETFALGASFFGPAVEYDTTSATPNAADSFIDVFSDDTTVPELSVLDDSNIGGDRIAVEATDPLVTTLLGSAYFRYPGDFQPDTAPGFKGDEFDFSSDAALNDGPTFQGDLEGILGSVEVEPGGGHNSVKLYDSTDATAANVTITSSLSLFNGVDIGGFAGAASTGTIISIANTSAANEFNPNTKLTLGTTDVTLVGSDFQPTVFSIGATLEKSDPILDKNPLTAGGNNLTIDGGASGGNEFDVQASTCNLLTINTGDGNANVVNFSSDAPMNTGNLAGITGAVVVNFGAADNTFNVSDFGGAGAGVVTLNGSSATNSGSISGLTTTPIVFNEVQGGQLATTIDGTDMFGTTFNVGSTLGAGNTLLLVGGSAGGNIFNIQNASSDSLVITTGDGNNNTVNLGSNTPALTGNMAGITTSVDITFGAGTGNKLNVSDKSDAGASANVSLDNIVNGAVTENAITGFTPPEITYSESGTLAVSIVAALLVPTTFDVNGTLGAGTTLTLTGSTAGQNVFNLDDTTDDAVTVNTGGGNGNLVNILAGGIGATTAVSVNGAKGTNTLTVDGSAGATSATYTLTKALITGATTLPIAYAEVPGGVMTVDLIGQNALSTTFNVNTTLPAGNFVVLQGGAGGGNQFNIASTSAANNGQLNNITSAVTVNGGAGIGNSLEVNDHGSTGAYNYLLSPTGVTAGTSTPARTFGGVTFANVQAVQLDATEQLNQITVTPSSTTTFTVNGYGPTATGAVGGNVASGKGDQLGINFVGVVGQTLTQTASPVGGNSYNGAWTFTNRAAVNFTNFEEYPVANVISAIPILAFGADVSVSGQPMVQVYNANSNVLVTQFLAFESTYHGGVHVAVGEFDSTGQPEIAVSPGAGHLPIVKIFDRFGKFLYQFQAYATSMQNGFNIAAGNVENLHSANGELDDIVTVPMRGVSEVRVFHNQSATLPAAPISATPIRDFTVWGTGFIGGSTVAVADLNGDNRGDVIVGSGSGMQPMIEAFNVTIPASAYSPFKIMYPFVATYRGGVNVSAISAGSGLAFPEIVASQGNSGTSNVLVFNGATGAVISNTTPFAGLGSNAPVRTVPKLINGHVYVFAAQLIHGQSTFVKEIDPSNGSVVDFLLENNPNFLGINLG